MKIKKSELVKIENSKSFDYVLDQRAFDNYPYLRSLRDVKGEIVIKRDLATNLLAHVSLKGNMICPCAITLEDVAVPFDLDEEVTLSFEDLDDSYFIANDLDLDDLVISLILPEVPIKVVKNAKIEYPSGDGWCVMTEEDLQDKKADVIDPRLAILKEYQFDEEE